MDKSFVSHTCLPTVMSSCSWYAYNSDKRLYYLLRPLPLSQLNDRMSTQQQGVLRELKEIKGLLLGPILIKEYLKLSN